MQGDLVRYKSLYGPQFIACRVAEAYYIIARKWRTTLGNNELLIVSDIANTIIRLLVIAPQLPELQQLARR